MNSLNCIFWLHIDQGYWFFVLICLATGSLDEIVRVSVESEEVKYVGNGYSVVLHFAPGYSLGVTETATIGEKRWEYHVVVLSKLFTPTSLILWGFFIPYTCLPVHCFIVTLFTAFSLKQSFFSKVYWYRNGWYVRLFIFTTIFVYLLHLLPI